MYFDNPICLFTSIVDILSIYFVVSSEAFSLVILNDSNPSDSVFISCSQY